jgi:hypothetical protein
MNILPESSDFGPSRECALLLGIAGGTKWPLLTAFFLSFSFFLSLCSGYFFLRRRYPCVMKLCIAFLLTKKKKFILYFRHVQT